ncbi:MAG: hypothetical protein DHS20C17_36220 [Cyclobacteriaceae bacterium]|nr:MAG: hypothetical protein DHS20C17_36220 [Cyclobacteriaceae bacterium]
MKAITIGYTESSYTLRVYFENEPSEAEKDLLKDITGQVSADVPEFIEFNEEAIIANPNIQVNKLEMLDVWVYMEYYNPV